MITFWVAVILAISTARVWSAIPDVNLPDDLGLADTAPATQPRNGSVLVYNLYSSGATNSPRHNTRISLTNTNQEAGVAVHFFLIDGTSGLVNSFYLCLRAQQTTDFLLSEVDPGITGYVMAVATDSRGLPIAFNWLIGEEYVKLPSGHQANLKAETISTAGDSLPLIPSQNPSLATLAFDGVHYQRLPRVLANSNMASLLDGNVTMLAVNRIGGNLADRAASTGTMFGIYYDDADSAYSFSFMGPGTSQSRNIFSNRFPHLNALSFGLIQRQGGSGWVKVWRNTWINNSNFPGGGINDGAAFLGAILNHNTAATPSNFSGAHNLHWLTLNPISFVQIPITPPDC
jgi:hypothetical protein